MENSCKDLLEQAIKNQINNLDYLDYGSSEMTKAVKDIDVLYRIKLDEEKETQNTSDSKVNKLWNRRFECIKIGITGAELLLPLAFYGFWLKRGFKYEEEGVFTSTTFKGLFSGLFNKIKRK